MLFPFRHSSIFRSRWIALFWAAGICLTASEIVDSVAGPSHKGGGLSDEASAVGDGAMLNAAMASLVDNATAQ